MTLTERSHLTSEVGSTSIWRGLVIAMAVLLHLLLAGKAHADEVMPPAVAPVQTSALADAMHISGHAARAGSPGSRLLDGEMQVAYAPQSALGVYAGYRLFAAESGGLSLPLHSPASGPFVGAFIRF